jgi:endonuclease-8
LIIFLIYASFASPDSPSNLSSTAARISRLIKESCMPEGPEIRRAADIVEAALKNRTLTGVFFAFDHLKRYEKDLKASTILGLETRGKAILTHTDRGLSIYSHNQLYGRWMVSKAGQVPKSNRQLRLALHNIKNSAWLYSASDIAVMETSELLRHPFLARIGPDIMSASLKQVMVQLNDPRFRRRRLGQLLLDQAFLAGVGNYLRSEALHVAGIHPLARPGDCGKKELKALGEAILALARRSYEHNGVTNDLAQASSLKAAGIPRREYRHWVFSREGRECFRCSGLITKIPVASRRLYLCSHCQPAPVMASQSVVN